MKVSVVIPTHNRQDTLQKAIQAYLNQTVPSNSFEILAVDDGSSDGTSQVVAGFMGRGPISIRYFRQEQRGPAAARNLGILESAGEIILFSDDDIVPARNLVAEHISWHEKYPEACVAVLGYVTWASEVEATPFMKWYGERGPLFAYAHLVGRAQIDSQFFYSYNVSLKAAFLRNNGTFDEEFTSAAFEDTELGYRLAKRGMRLLYNPAAVGYHYQRFSLEDACRRAQRVGAARRIFERKEAGIRILELEARRNSRWTKRLGKWMVARLVAALTPFRRLLDSRVNLPSFVYRAFLWYYATEAERASRQSEEETG
jgi:glycosyltransferase involved in cell wall biosynthesis